MRKVLFTSLGIVILSALNFGCATTGTNGAGADLVKMVPFLPYRVTLDTLTFEPFPGTVRNTLTKLKAVCRGGKLLDGSGREIKFIYSPEFGAPPNQAKENRAYKIYQEQIEEYSKKYTVIVVDLLLQ